jgi:hypothetical protein
MRKFLAVMIVTVASSAAACLPASAQFSLPGVGGALPIPGLGGGGGGGFSSAAAALGTNLKTALYNQGMALSLVQEAMGNKDKAKLFRTQASAIQSVKGASLKDPMVKMQKTIEDNPINLEGLAKVTDAAGQKKVAEAQGHMDIVIVYNGLALVSAAAMITQKPGPADLAGAPVILETAQLALTAIPTQTTNFKKFNDAVSAYMKTNNVPKLSTAQKTALAKKTDPKAAANM